MSKPNYILDHMQDVAHNLFVRRRISKITKDGQPLFSEISIETNNQCNGGCRFCPVNRFYVRPKVEMSIPMFRGIIEQLVSVNYSGDVFLYGNNEPLIDDRISDFANYVKKELRNCRLILYSNAILLTNEKLISLMRNVDLFIIDNYRGEQGKAEISKLNLLRFGDKIKVSSVDELEIRTSRGGQAPNKIAVRGLRSPCHYPFSSIYVRSNGDVSQCCYDGLGKAIMGNISKQSLFDIWYGCSFEDVRKRLLKSRQRVKICSRCDVFLTYPEWFRKLKRLFFGGIH